METALRGRQLDGLRFRRQHLVAGYIVDFYCPALRLAIEVDGELHDAREREDVDRGRALTRIGCVVLRLRNDRVLCQLEQAVDCIAKVCARIADTSPRKSGGGREGGHGCSSSATGPSWPPSCCAGALHRALPAYSEVRLESTDLTDLAPAEYRADLVVLLVDGTPVLGIVVEVQLRRDDRKRFTWPVYVAGLRARLECPACVLVVTSSDAVADWCRMPIDLGPGGALSPLVVGPASVPVFDDANVAERDPELAVLSVLAHGHEPHAEAIGRAALLATLRLSDERQLLYSDLVFAALSQAARAALEDLMAGGTYEFQSEFAKKHQAKGRADGEAQGFAKAVLEILEARGFSISDEVRAGVLACTDSAQLAAWVRKAVAVASVDELF